MLEKMSQSSGNVIGYKITGKIMPEDYEQLVPEVEALVAKEGHIRLVIDMTQFQGEAMKAWGADWQFGREFHDKIDKLAVIGDKVWERLLMPLAKPFYAHAVKVFHSDEADAAWEWAQS